MEEATSPGLAVDSSVCSRCPFIFDPKTIHSKQIRILIGNNNIIIIIIDRRSSRRFLLPGMVSVQGVAGVRLPSSLLSLSSSGSRCARCRPPCLIPWVGVPRYAEDL